jgi:hypothetical protein
MIGRVLCEAGAEAKETAANLHMLQEKICLM